MSTMKPDHVGFGQAVGVVLVPAAEVARLKKEQQHVSETKEANRSTSTEDASSNSDRGDCKSVGEV
jgi:hypothetical protein